MRRRDFIRGIAGTAAGWPLAARAQQPTARVRRIAVLLRVAQDDPDAQRDLQSFRKGLWELGWTAGKNILSAEEEALLHRPRSASFDDVTDTGRLHYRFCQANFVDTGETLHAGGDIHVLPEVVDPVVEPYGNGPASVHTDLKAERP